VLHGSSKWNSALREYANYSKSDGKLAIGAQLMVDDLSQDPYGICYSEITFITPQTKTLALAAKDNGPYVELTMENVRNRTYPLYDQVYMYTNGGNGRPIDPKTKEYLMYIASREGQEDVQHDGKYLPLTAEVSRQQLEKLQ
jgi:phosphate transport system substrate-binding protein